LKKIIIANLVITLSLLSAVSALATSYSISIAGINSPYGGNMPQYGGEYVGPIVATINGTNIPGGMICDDFNDVTPVPTAYKATIETISNLSGAMFVNEANSLKLYEEAAWLNGQINSKSTATQIGEIQFAIWELFSHTNAEAQLLSNAGSGEQSIVANLMTTAAAQNFANYNFDSVEIITPDDGSNNQEFITGCPTPIPNPEPGTMMLFGVGITGLAIYSRRRNNSKG